MKSQKQMNPLEKRSRKIKEEFLKGKFILDACCGPRLFWFNKSHPNTLFIDNRKREKGYNDYRKNREIQPDIIMDFRKLEFPDKSFKLVIMDPPHIFAKGENFRMVKDYGWLNKETWKEDIKKGFDECWRVLDDYGVLVFKWNEASVKKKEVLEVINKIPLFGHPNASKISTHWFVFMKIPELIENKLQKQREDELKFLRELLNSKSTRWDKIIREQYNKIKK